MGTAKPLFALLLYIRNTPKRRFFVVQPHATKRNKFKGEKQMNKIWSGYIQGANTLYYSRRLRFDDAFAGRYKPLFAIDEDKKLKILEIGCGPGALAGALHRWYPKAEITAIDRDSEFIRFAREREKGIDFSEADATALPFAEGTFDAVISYTVSEHVEPSAFYKEQLRVLKKGGICLVLSARKGINVTAACLTPNEYESKFWEKVSKYDDAVCKYGVGKYAKTEAELPVTMEKHGFRNVKTGFAVADLTPDNCPAEKAHAIIDAERYSELDRIDSVQRSIKGKFTEMEIEEMKRLINAKYDCRIAQYDRGEKQWDTSVSVIMVARGVK